MNIIIMIIIILIIIIIIIIFNNYNYNNKYSNNRNMTEKKLWSDGYRLILKIDHWISYKFGHYTSTTTKIATDVFDH